MLHTPHEFQQYFALAADRHRSLLADAAAHRLITGATGAGPMRRLRWALGDLLLIASGGRCAIAGARLTAGRPRAATVHSSST